MSHIEVDLPVPKRPDGWAAKLNAAITATVHVVDEHGDRIDVLEEVVSGEATSAELAEHINAENPHPHYDDIHDLVVLLENGMA